MTYASPFYNLSDSEWKYYITVQGGNPLNILNYTKYFTIVSWYISGKSGDEYPTFTEVEFKP